MAINEIENYNPFITANPRVTMSKALKYLLENKMIVNTDYVLDYGAGRLRDVFELRMRGIKAKAYDRYADYYSTSDESLIENDDYSVICCTHIFEHIKSKAEHNEILKKIRTFSAKKYIALRNDYFSKKKSWSFYEEDQTYFTGYYYLRFYDIKKLFDWFGKHKILIKNNEYILIEII